MMKTVIIEMDKGEGNILALIDQTFDEINSNIQELKDIRILVEQVNEIKKNKSMSYGLKIKKIDLDKLYEEKFNRILSQNIELKEFKNISDFKKWYKNEKINEIKKIQKEKEDREAAIVAIYKKNRK